MVGVKVALRSWKKRWRSKLTVNHSTSDSSWASWVLGGYENRNNLQGWMKFEGICDSHTFLDFLTKDLNFFEIFLLKII